MTELTTPFLDSIRFSGDRELAAHLGELDIRGALGEAAITDARRQMRKNLLATAVRVDPRMLPKLDASIRAVRERARFEQHLEAYIFEDPTINAFLSSGIKHTFLGLSSGAVNTLSEPELEFVIGHELGHALFGHTEIELANRLRDDELETRALQHVLAWKRAGEISADRCGLVCCGSLEVAATALFRTLSGLNTPDLAIKPDDFSEQWDHLLAEVVEQGVDDMWQTTHPFPPMRMKAMVLFWESNADALPTDRPGARRPLDEIDDEIERVLATIDPLARERRGGADPLLEDIIVWGGYAIASASAISSEAESEGDDVVGDRVALDPEVVERLAQIAPSAADAHADAEKAGAAGCLQRLERARASRRRKLPAQEIYRVLESMLVLGGDFEPSSPRFEAYCAIGDALGIEREGCQVVRERYLAKADVIAAMALVARDAEPANDDDKDSSQGDPS